MTPKQFDISGRTIIVTGASRGIGKGIVQVLAEAGAKVLVTALTDRFLKPFAAEMESAGTPIKVLTADATDAAEWEKTVGMALDLWGHVDVLINNLGDAITKPLVPAPGSSDAPMSDDEWRQIIDINLTDAFLGCRAIGPHFLERRNGRVINISGFAARRGVAGLTAYSAAKAGLANLTQTLALEWAGYGVNVNAIAPGSFPDPENATPEQMAERQRRAEAAIPLGRVGHPREIGYLALYLASDASSYMTGETLYIDGGMSYAMKG